MLVLRPAGKTGDKFLVAELIAYRGDQEMYREQISLRGLVKLTLDAQKILAEKIGWFIT